MAQFINLLSFLTKKQVSLLNGRDVTHIGRRRNVNSVLFRNLKGRIR